LPTQAAFTARRPFALELTLLLFSYALDAIQMASTAAGVAVGSTVGHGLSSMLFGGGSSQAAPVAEPQQQSFEERRMGGSCDIQAKGEFLLCIMRVDLGCCSLIGPLWRLVSVTVSLTSLSSLSSLFSLSSLASLSFVTFRYIQTSLRA
jgi:hypothetical protein